MTPDERHLSSDETPPPVPEYIVNRGEAVEGCKSKQS